jgi:hypothetical protein
VVGPCRLYDVPVRVWARLLATAVPCLVLVSGFTTTASAARAPDLASPPADGLTRALASGEITEARYALERATALFAPEEVERRYGSLRDSGPRGATVVLRDLVARLGSLTPTERARAEAILARPDDGAADPFAQGYSVPAVPPTCTEHFCVHWVPTSSDAPASADTDANGLPDQIDQTARTLEEVWQREIVEYGYRPPKADGTSPNHGPDDRLDVYLGDVGTDGIYGYCTTDDPVAFERPSGPWDVSTYCVLDNDYDPAQFPGGASGLPALQVTAAHEFFHAVQFAYDFLEDGWMLEGTAVWMEDEVYDDVNDNYQYFDKSQLRQPQIPLDLAVADFESPLSGYQYGAFVFWRYLEEQHGGTDVIRRAWEFADGSAGAQDQYSLQAVDSALRERGSSFRAAFARFGAVNAYPARYYEEGAAYPSPQIQIRSTLSRARASATRTVSLNHLTSWYAAFRPSAALGAATRLRVALDLPRRARGGQATLIVVLRTGEPRLVPIVLNAQGDGARTVSFAPRDVKAVQLVLTNASGRFRCWSRTPLTCQGESLDDEQPFSYEARLVGVQLR